MKLKERFSVERLRAKADKRNRSGRFNRTGAYLIDHLLMVAVENILILIFWLIFWGLGQVTPGGDINLAILPKAFQTPIILFILLLTIGYQVIVPLYVLEDQTYGKRLIGLKIVRNDGSKATLSNYLLRLLGMFLEGNAYVSFIGGVTYLFYFQFIPQYAETINMTMGYIFALSVLIGFFHPDRRAIHDFIAGTKVVYVTPHDLADYSRPISDDIDLSNI